MANTRRRLPGALVCLSLAAATLLAPATARAQATPGAASPSAAPRTAAPASSSPAVNVPPCAMSDLWLREANTTTEHGHRVAATYVVQNRGAAACRTSGGVGIRLLDARDNELPLRFAPRTAMALLLTLAPGGEASFTVAYASPVPARCTPADRIAVFIPPQTTPLTAPSTIAACTGALVRVSNLSAGAPRTLSPC